MISPITCNVSYRGWGVLGFPTPSSISFPYSIIIVCRLYCILCITFLPQWHQVLYMHLILQYEMLIKSKIQVDVMYIYNI